MNKSTIRWAAFLLIALAAVVGVLQLNSQAYAAHECTGNYSSCLAWCAGAGSNAYGSFGACRQGCRSLYCDF